MLIGMCGLPSVTKEVSSVSELSVSLGSITTSFGGGLTLPALYASASSR
jgi:hypothetical protein